MSNVAALEERSNQMNALLKNTKEGEHERKLLADSCRKIALDLRQARVQERVMNSRLASYDEVIKQCSFASENN